MGFTVWSLIMLNLVQGSLILQTIRQLSNYSALIYQTTRRATQISIGGPYSVHGYKKQGLGGNKGFYWKNTLSHKYGRLEPYIALDGGYISKQSDSNGGIIIGNAIGLKIRNADTLSTNLFLSTPLRKTDTQIHENFLGLELQYNF